MPEETSTHTDTVRIGIDCIGCGYDLAGLPIKVGAVCPECGLPVKDSLTGPLLRLEGVEWVRRVEKGLDRMHVGLSGTLFTAFIGTVVILIVFACVFFVLSMFQDEPDMDKAGRVVEHIFDWALTLVVLWFNGLAVVGMWQFTSPCVVTNDHETEEGVVPWRLFARSFPFTLAGAMLIGKIFSDTAGTGVAWSVFSSVTVLVFGAALWLGFHGMCRRLSFIDGRCAGARAYAPVRFYSGNGLVLRILLLGIATWFGYLEGMKAIGLPFGMAFLGLLIWMRRFSMIADRVRTERLASEYRTPATIPSP